MPDESDRPSENPYEPSAVEDPTLKQPKARSLAASLGLGVAVIVASGIAFVATCTVGGIAGIQVSQSAGAVSEGAMGYGVMTGVIVGAVSALAVAFLLSRKLFRRSD